MTQVFRWAPPALVATVSLIVGAVCALPETASADPLVDTPGVARGVDLAQARERALASNPELQAARSVVAEAGGALRQARAWNNPEFEIEAEDVGGDRPGWDQAEITWSVVQRMELFGARGARTAAARHGRDSAIHSVDIVRRDLLATVDRRFADALAARSRIEALSTGDSIAAETVRAVTALVDAGEVSPIELDRAQAERASVSTRLIAARLEHAEALRALCRLWGGTEADATEVEGSLEILPRLPDRDSLLACAAKPPDLRLTESEVRRAEAELRLAGRERFPELAIRGGLRRFRASDEQTYVGSLGLSLPLLDRKDGARDGARARLERTRIEHAALARRITLARAGAYDALARALETATILRERSLPRAQAVHAAVQEGYRRGKFSLLDLLDADRFLLQARLETIDALRSAWDARAELDRIVRPDAAEAEGVSS
jgi:outer membrane protein, heavy metal efflux system